MKKILLLPILCPFYMAICQTADTTKTLYLQEVEVHDTLLKNRIKNLPPIYGVVIYAGKKNEVIQIKSMDADLSTNNTRQIFAKVPGITIWENDGSGIQVGVAARGLSPNRSWEFNVRQNGYDISADAFGYPEAYYNPPMEAVEKIEVVRGAAGLSFGPQFGGLLNYVLKGPDTKKSLVYEGQTTIGSYGLINTYQSLGGSAKKWSYFGYYHGRKADGWRENSRYQTNNLYGMIRYQWNPKLRLSAEWTSVSSQTQQAGGLLDSILQIDARSSVRNRNWFETPWNVGSLSLDYRMSPQSQIQVKIFGLLAQRNSVGYTKAINIADTFNTAIGSYNLRQVDRDAYENIGMESRFLQRYSLGSQTSALSVGVRMYQNQTTRKQQGIGSPEDDLDLSIYAYSNGKEFARVLALQTQNMALFVENMFQFGEKLRISPGLRYEIITSGISGHINSSSTGSLAESTKHRAVFLAGLGTEYQVSAKTNLYANASQSFRPVTFSELTPSSTSDVIDPHLKDAQGYNIDGGWRGSLSKCLSFDVGGFYLYYDQRIGSLQQNGYIFKTNIGTSVSQGLEALIEFDPFCLIKDKSIGSWRLFASYAYVDAKYTQWNNPTLLADPSKNIQGKRVEYAPEHTLRSGFSYQLKNISFSFNYSQISEVFTDAANTEKPNSSGTVGKIAGYQVMDASLSWILMGKYSLKGGVNNLSNEVYATRRSGGYPGPGLLPGNGRTFYVSIGAKF